MTQSVRQTTRLVFVANADDMELSSSSHVLDDLDEVRFGRGPRTIERTGRTLTLRLPDDRMSSTHGTLRRQGQRWQLDDPSSKNGTVIDGTATRTAILDDGALLELGHSFFVFRQAAVARIPHHLSGDASVSDLPALPTGMATFVPQLACELEALAHVAASNVSIIVLGETGTGKEILARAIHELSARKGEFIAVNCGALPPTLLESELFGYKRGAFSGAVSDRKGLIRSADGGSLFLDEIGELPAPSQAALLRVLQEREVLPIGTDRPIAVDLRVIAATLRDLELAIAEDTFRDDLYARLCGHTIELPPLRARRDDLGILLSAIVPRLANRPMRFAPSALRTLLRYRWPHNIRELEQVLATAIVIARNGTIEHEHLAAKLRKPAEVREAPPAAAPAPELDADDQQLRAQLVDLLASHSGNVMTVAETLGKRRAQIYKWVKRLGIDLAAFRRPA